MKSVWLASEGSRLEKAYIMVRLLCWGLSAEHRERSAGAQLAGVTNGTGPVLPLASAAPPVHRSCHANLPSWRVRALSAAMLAS